MWDEGLSWLCRVQILEGVIHGLHFSGWFADCLMRIAQKWQLNIIGWFTRSQAGTVSAWGRASHWICQFAV